MQAIAKVAVFGLGVLGSSAALANDSFAGPPIYKAQYAYNASPYYYGGYPTSWPYYAGYPNYYGYYPVAPAYAWDPTAPSHPILTRTPIGFRMPDGADRRTLSRHSIMAE